ncbi:two component transcriptional regulator, LuxR family [Salegentibacter echinorum]|uniref:Two component transcriptional regulator, LuxR family n=1 Tax=Salegentibacter echinorum TaxID=1073325 RepID=A0A1M5C9D0_SALEC|nr:response regulator transcription factor [Salegentibacter echinorum]SHF51022.1 two component transcriptional regulator, LuxR family [Salegentibacter echinorum]
MIRLAIAEDHLALIDGIKIFFEYEEDIEFVGFAQNGQELCELVKRKRPNLIITDIRMPVMDGIEATRKILKNYPEIKIIAFTMFDQDAAVSQMLKAGAKGYILKNSSLKELLFAMRQVHKGETYYDPNITLESSGETSKTKGVLTRRQHEILKLIAKGKTNQEIAEQLFIGKTTVETHRKNMIRKLDLHGAGELLRYALEKKYDF